MSYTLLYPTRYDITPIQEALETSGVLADPIETPDDLKIGDDVTVFLLDAPSRSDFTISVLKRFLNSGGAVEGPIGGFQPRSLSRRRGLAARAHLPDSRLSSRSRLAGEHSAAS